MLADVTRNDKAASPANAPDHRIAKGIPLLSQLPPDQRARFHVQLSPSSARGDLGDFVFKAARKLHLFFTRHPWLEDCCARTAHSCWRQYKRLKKVVTANHADKLVVTHHP